MLSPDLVQIEVWIIPDPFPSFGEKCVTFTINGGLLRARRSAGGLVQFSVPYFFMTQDALSYIRDRFRPGIARDTERADP
jgi:hypothetical protein